jgi:hypothetical protein
MIKEIEIGRWGNIALFASIDENKKVKSIKIVSPKKILKDRFGNLLFEDEETPFMKAVLVSEKEGGNWIYYISFRNELEQIFRKLAKRGIYFQPNPELFASKGSRDIDSITEIVPA